MREENEMKRQYNEPKITVKSFMRESVLTASGEAATAVQSVMKQLSEKKNELSISEMSGVMTF